MSKLSGTANDGTRSLNARVLSESPSTLSESAGASGLADEIEKDLNDYVNNTDPEHNSLLKGALEQTLWDNKAAIVAYLRRAAPVQAEPVAWGRVIQGKCVTVSLEKTPANDEPLYASPPTPVLGEAWQPIETAPKDGTAILCFWRYEPESKGCAGVASYSADEIGENSWHDPDDRETEYGEPKFWMPLPSPPVSAGLDDMGKQRLQIEESRVADGPNAKAGIE